MSTTNKELGNKLRVLREIHNYTQEYLANVLDVAPNTYSLMEKGQAQFTIDRIEKLAQFYKMDITDFMKLSDQNIIHTITHSNGICSDTVNIHNNGLADEEKNLYKDMIKRLEEQNDKLIKLIDKLSDKIN
jgi:transcriptional regulator with XRE-family HTH domain